ncbi:MAG: hypothetical protein A2W61_01125 [Deltaproteobacteria bacterium RIFCSPLOWO2_01_44_7]|nr:MAG: hypothetical protein A2712_03955 [Deltaproteobacteria bacterium RIFCSPHIGHO2_01_FULL_43_49]OGQ16340.1 MAG: hypothetical protein A3D22_01925 [Deltaproteobacteria bacterium RIFCSPHIGHO2_02_FULL_44_53]OGQ29301.1 MAG: hypothetical protein A3D98_05710 [Deltaproteobacteria bacterium RIFCSPHIGHO2_12_FULL_44_21]OGQ32858.1 MAG: hypothetical protein A2979_09855 [Deltaproteobacteria bacterium RIFCSPLOWO2_01_FULL_45_74]OGQ38523.1 MAG: hypothetical protein A2W61_01125 [Deltaproteobacteria bacterium 
MRLDLYLAQQTKLSRHQVQKMIENGSVRVAGKTILKPAFKVQGDEGIEYKLPEPESLELKPEAIPLDILYEDDQIAVINKPADLVIHPAVGHREHTLVNALLHRYGELPQGSDAEKPGIVHRLDKGTSGVMVVARTEAALKELQRQFKNREVEKIYLALVVGKLPPQGEIDKPIGRSSGNRKKISSRTKKGREALTEWKLLESFGNDLSWVQVKLHTGRTHQIRVHFTEEGHPLVGDPTYGRKNKVFKESIQRPALHASKLTLTHPVTNEKMNFEAPLPEDIQKLLSYLRKNGEK